jgi:hypothetical protein
MVSDLISLACLAGKAFLALGVVGFCALVWCAFVLEEVQTPHDR